VLGSCKKAASVKRVVLTSSTAAMYDHPGESPMIDESSWNELSHAGLNAYSCSKVRVTRFALSESPYWRHSERTLQPNP